MDVPLFMMQWREKLLMGLLFTTLTILIASLALNVEGWLLRYLLNLPL
jgi:hypothetical protein